MLYSPVVIHKDNVNYGDLNQISFNTEENVDKSIVDLLVAIDKDYEYDVLIIKDSLSEMNYLDFYGLLLAHHIRLSENFRGRYYPIVIVSDLDVLQLNTLTPLARILFTKGIYLTSNNINSIKQLLSEELLSINEKIIKEDFLEKISIEPPSNYESSHSIANEWSIYRWSKALVGIDDIVNDTDNMLYFKYLKMKHPAEINNKFSTSKLIKNLKGKVLYIDDEWEKGWSKILDNILKLGADYQYLDSINKETDKNNIQKFAIEKVKSFNPDVVLLDLRLNDSDFIEDNPEKLTGIQILEKIKDINQGIQVIIFTASEKSLILEKALSLGALGYIKKEHPESYNLSIEENISNLIELVSKGFDQAYLKEVHEIKSYIIGELNKNPFIQYNIVFPNEDEKEINYLALLKNNIEYIFDILNTTLQNRYNYAMVSIATSLETIVKIFLYEKVKYEHLYFWDDKPVRSLNEKSPLQMKIDEIINTRFGNTNDIKLGKLIEYRNDYMHSNENIDKITKKKILEWLKTYMTVISSICNPIQYERYDEKKARKKKHHNFNRQKSPI